MCRIYKSMVTCDTAAAGVRDAEETRRDSVKMRMTVSGRCCVRQNVSSPLPISICLLLYKS
jgi:hypothetical protein